MHPPPENPSLTALLTQWQDASPSGRELFEAKVIAQYPALGEEFAAQVHELRALEAEDRRKASEQPGDVVGCYKLLQEIGAGGFGTVFEAEQTEPVRRRVAVKILKAGMDTQQFLARFEAERQALALMDHPNIAKVLDAGATDKGRPYFVMELVRGEPITNYCDRHKLSTEERLKLFNSVCEAIQHAHHKGVIHRDIKPSNILVAVHDDVPVAKVIDFGIAKAIGARLTDRTVVTMRGFFIGTLEYMSPEQAEVSGVDIDTRSDVYSLGVLLYELLTGRLPFDKETLRKAALSEGCRIVREVDPPKPSTRLTTAPPAEQTETARRRKCSPANLSTVLRGELDWVVMRALEKDRTRRYATADAFAEDLRRHLAGEAVEARPPSALYSLRKLARRHRLAFAAGTAVLVSLLVGLAVTTAFYFEKRAALRQTERLAYAANIRMAQQAWDDGNGPLSRELLDRARDRPEQPDMRGFEWYYMHRLAHRELLTFKGDRNFDVQPVFSPDGRRLASRGKNNTVKVSDSRSGEQLFTLKGHTNLVDCMAFSPDGRRLASGSRDQTVKVWDAASGGELLSLKGHTNTVNFLAFTRDGHRLVSTSAGCTLKIWDVASGKQLPAAGGPAKSVLAVH